MKQTNKQTNAALHSPTLKLIGFSLISLISIPAAHAASVAWLVDSTKIVSTADIITTGALVHAGSWGSGDKTVTFGSNSILFAERTYGGSGYLADMTGRGVDGGPKFFTGDTGSTEFNAVLDSSIYDNHNTRVLTLGGLTSGDIYQMQLFVSDGRDEVSGRTQRWSDTAAQYDGNETTLTTHGTEFYVVGQFTADANTQKVYTYGEDYTVLNAYVLRQVPEPSGAILALSGFAMLALRRRRA